MKNVFLSLFCFFAMVFTVYTIATEDIKPGGGKHFAFGQTGPTGPTGPTGGNVNGRSIFTGSAPTLSVCGASPTIATGGTDNGAIITVGANSTNVYGVTVPVMACTITFSTAFSHAPSFALSGFQNGFRPSVAAGSLTTTGVIINFNSDGSKQKFSFVAF